MSLSFENRFRSNSFTQIEDAIEKTTPYNTIKSKKSAWEQFSQFLVERKYELEEDTSQEDLAKVLEDYGYKYEKEKVESQETLNTEEDIKLDQEIEEEETPESVDELRERLENMKKLMADRNQNNDNKAQRRKPATDVIDGNFLSIMFALTLFVILVVSIYAFYNLFWAIWKRNSRYHEEL